MDRSLPPARPDDTATTQTVLTFDDNRRASTLFGQYGQNLALIERRLGVVADSRGNQVTIEGSRDGCERARRVLEGLYEQIKRGHDLSQGDVEGAIRLAIAQGSLFDFDPADLARRVRGDQPAQAPGARAHRRAGRLYARAQAPRARVRRRPGRHRQDLARGRARGRAVRAQGGRPHRRCRAPRSRPASGSASCRATCARRSIPICGRSTTRCST